jgi:hypothetical protein
MADPRSLPDVDHLTMDVVLLDEGDLDGRFRGNAALAAVADRATRSDLARFTVSSSANRHRALWRPDEGNRPGPVRLA